MSTMVAGIPRHQVGLGDHRAQRQAGGNSLCAQQDVGLDAPVLDRPHLAGAAGARLDLVGNQQDAVAVAQRAQSGQEFVVGDDVAALTLDRLDEDRRDLFSRHELLEDAIFQLVETGQAVRHVHHARQQRPKARVIAAL